MEFSATTPSPLSSTTTGKVSFITILFCSWLMIHNSTAPFPPATALTRWGLSQPFHLRRQPQRPQRVITTRWRLSLPLHLRRQPQQPPTSHYDSLGRLSHPFHLRRQPQ